MNTEKWTRFENGTLKSKVELTDDDLNEYLIIINPKMAIKLDFDSTCNIEVKTVFHFKNSFNYWYTGTMSGRKTATGYSIKTTRDEKEYYGEPIEDYIKDLEKDSFIVICGGCCYNQKECKINIFDEKDLKKCKEYVGLHSMLDTGEYYDDGYVCFLCGTKKYTGIDFCPVCGCEESMEIKMPAIDPVKVWKKLKPHGHTYYFIKAMYKHKIETDIRNISCYNIPGVLEYRFSAKYKEVIGVYEFFYILTRILILLKRAIDDKKIKLTKDELEQALMYSKTL